MSPEEITRALCKVHRCRDLAQVTDEYGFEQVKPAPVWENIGLDLALGNIDQPFWGWADPRTIFALDYWAASIPQLTFVLVYDEPHSVLFAKALARTVRAAEFSNDEAVEQALNNWAAFNAALVRFHLRNPKRTLLVQGSATVNASGQCLEKLQALLGHTFLADEVAEPLAGPNKRPSQERVVAALKKIGVSTEGGAPFTGACIGGPHEALAERYLVDAVVEQHSSVRELYSELQSLASFPENASIAGSKVSAVTAWRALVGQRNLYHGAVLRLLERGDQANVGRSGGGVDNRGLISGPSQGKAGERDATSHTTEAGPSSGATHTLGGNFGSERIYEENELLLAQLHKAQEELEGYHLRAKELENRKKNLEKALLQAQREAEVLKAEADSALREKNKRIQRLEAVRYGKQKRIDSLKSKLGELQVELEDGSKRPIDLSGIPGRLMLKVAFTRLAHRFFPAFRKDRSGSDQDERAGP